MSEIVITIVGIVFSAIIAGMQYKVRKMEQDIASKMSKKEVRELIEDKLEVQRVQLEDVKKDLDKIDVKLDNIRDLFGSNK